MKADQLLGALERGKVPVVTVVHGPEPWFADRAAGAVRARFLEGDESGEYEAVRGPVNENDRDGVRLGPMLDSLRTVPMFGGRRVVYYHAGVTEDQELDALVAFAASGSSFARLVVRFADLGKKRAGALAKAGASVAEARKLFDTPWPGKPEWDTALNKWAAARAREKSLRMDLRVAHVLTGIIGNELGMIESAIEKLAITGVERGTVTEEDIRALTGGGRDYDGFAFGEAIYSRDPKKAFAVCRSAFEEGVTDKAGRRTQAAPGIAARLLWSVHFRLQSVFAAREQLDAGRTDEEVVASLGRNVVAARRGVAQARTFDRDTLARHLVLLADADAELRLLSGCEGAILEGLIPVLTGVVDV